ncbi:MAG: hypothetical protein JO318_03910 [Chloroflexi bacterium]|nr:hypothetical protein [Chloroflexota bacterium]MBV9131814.1 hypothetical protein [Chloroflexota bacterium]
MASRLIDWTLAHLRLMWAFVGVTFVIMLFIPDARWNAITTVWGALFLGLLISLVLEQRGEGIQRRVWLSQNSGRTRTAVDELLAVVEDSAALAVDMPAETLRALTSGATRAARREAAEHARADVWNRAQDTATGQDTNRTPADDLLGYAQQAIAARERLLALRQRHRVVLSHVAQLDLALDRFLDALRWYEGAAVAEDNPWPRDARAARYFLQPIGESAVGLCEACADLLFEARLLPP